MKKKLKKNPKFDGFIMKTDVESFCNNNLLRDIEFIFTVFKNLLSRRRLLQPKGLMLIFIINS